MITASLPAPANAAGRVFRSSGAITLAQRPRPDFIFLELPMPDVSGVDFVEILKRNIDTARIPILAVTAQQIAALDRAALTSNPAKVSRIFEKPRLSSARFIAEARRALPVPQYIGEGTRWPEY